MNPADRQSIEHFVRTRLGCKCPDIVFSEIELDERRTPATATAYQRLLVGDRLLIYITDAATNARAATTIAELTRQGCKERDAKAYNRFRLVIATADSGSLSAQAADAFSNAISTDDRAHLHVLTTDQLPDPLRRP